METFLSFSSFGSLLKSLNVILIGVVVFFAFNKYAYLIDVIVYSLSKTFIPIITSLIFGGLLGIKLNIGFGTILLLLILYFILGLIVIKVTEKITDWFGADDSAAYFISIFAVIDSILSWLFALLLSLFIR